MCLFRKARTGTAHAAHARNWRALKLVALFSSPTTLTGGIGRLASGPTTALLYTTPPPRQRTPSFTRTATTGHTNSGNSSNNNGFTRTPSLPLGTTFPAPTWPLKTLMPPPISSHGNPLLRCKQPQYHASFRQLPSVLPRSFSRADRVNEERAVEKKASTSVAADPFRRNNTTQTLYITKVVHHHPWQPPRRLWEQNRTMDNPCYTRRCRDVVLRQRFFRRSDEGIVE